ncbi:MAG: outer membrane beta-barrel family protein [Chitinophagaceae bacterium]|nr:outer membrane beta-barrel family protein [Chitinophagaceae bacterium]
MVNDDGGVSINWSGDEFSWGRGLPSSYTGGLHFSNKWNKDKHNSNNTYQFNQLDVRGITTNKSQTILPDTTFFNNTVQDQVSSRLRHRLTSIYEWQIDSTSSLKITARASTVKSTINNNYLGRSISRDSIIINETARDNNTSDDNNTLNTTFFYRKKFKKNGRSITANTDLNFNNREENGFLFAKNNFFDKTGVLVKTENIDQKKVNKQNINGSNSLVTYTEPLWKNTFLILNYRLTISRNDAERNTLVKSVGNAKYETIVDTLSNHFIFNTIGHTGGINFRYNTKKYNFNIGTGFGSVEYRTKDIRKNAERSISFTNFLPQINLNYTPKQQRRVSFSYNGSTRNPTLQQIQPLIDNTDPLNITIGNPNLGQSFIHTLNFRASDYKVLKSRSISFNVNYTATDNAISNASFVDSLGRRVNQAINVQGNYNLSTTVGYGFDIIPSLNLSFDVGPRKSRFVNRVNGRDNITDNTSLGLYVYSGFWSDKWFNYWMNFSANYNSSKTSIRPDIVTKYWTYNVYSNAQFKLKKIKTYIDVGLEANLYQKTDVFANQRDVYIINSSVRKIISKNDNWEIKASVNDLLNQNLGISRSVNSNFISETTNQTIQRYFLFSLIWNFNKNGNPTNNGF